MSANLCWKPSTKAKGSLPDALKFILRDILLEGPRHFTENDRDYLTGLRDAKVEGAQELLDLIEKHEEVVLWLEY